MRPFVEAGKDDQTIYSFQQSIVAYPTRTAAEAGLSKDQAVYPVCTIHTSVKSIQVDHPGGSFDVPYILSNGVVQGLSDRLYSILLKEDGATIFDAN
jgi:hypothetical protein